MEGEAAIFGFIPLIIVFPVIGLLINAFFGRYLGERVASWVGVGAAALSFVIAVLAWATLQTHPDGGTVTLYTWILTGGGFQVPVAFLVDTLSVTMMLVVTGVGTLIHIYAVGYMHGDDRFSRFFVYLNLFLASMLILVTANNYLLMFVGWELVGLCSYLLIGFWWDKPYGEGVKNSTAARKAMIANRVGDWGMVLAIILIWGYLGNSVEFGKVFATAASSGAAATGIITLITLLLLLGATGKSAQIPLYVWLPDAMAGPTPVSALIHAATMVTAGIYMITRSHVLFGLAPVSQTVVFLIGAATALLAATIAVGQYDIKRVLAYSTISQLGFMIAAVGMGAYVAGMFHLVTHAFFKALLFLAAGSVIHGVEHYYHAQHGHHEADQPETRAVHEVADATGHGGIADGERLPVIEGISSTPPSDYQPVDYFQDMRNMGGLARRMPWTFAVYVIGALALAGIPPFAGFFSKDEILGEAWKMWQASEGVGAANYPLGPVGPMLVWILLTIAAFFTAFYMGRQILMVFFGKPRTEDAHHATESGATMVAPLVVLAALSVVGGLINFPGLDALHSWLERTLAQDAGAALGFNPLVAGIATILAVVAIVVSYLLYNGLPVHADDPDPLQDRIGRVFTWLNQKWYVDELYDFLFLRPFRQLGLFLADQVDWAFWHDFFHETMLAGAYNGWARFLSQPFDKGIIDGAANGLARLVQNAGRGLRRVQTGYARSYALSFLVGVIIVVAFFLLVR